MRKQSCCFSAGDFDFSLPTGEFGNATDVGPRWLEIKAMRMGFVWHLHNLTYQQARLQDD